MSLLEKLGIIEYDEVKQPADVISDSIPDEEVITENVSAANVVFDVYEANGIADLSRSIYKAKEFIDAMPKEMPVQSKKTSVLSIIQATGMTVEDLEADAENRKTMLCAAKDSIMVEKDEVIANAESDIEKLEAMIAELNQVIYQAKVEKENVAANIGKEIEMIDSVAQFIGGEK